MPIESNEANLLQIRDIITRLENPIADISTLQALLAAPLGCINLLPPKYFRYSVTLLPSNALNVSKHIPPFQKALLEYVIPSWEPALQDADSYSLVEQYFCPDPFIFASPAAAEVASHAYSTILSFPLTKYSIRFLVGLSKAYPIDILWSSFFSNAQGNSRGRQSISWEDCVRNVSAVPAKVANALGPTGDVPAELQHGKFFNNMSLRTDVLISSLRVDHTREDTSAVTYLLTKLVNIGIFPASKPSLPTQPSFFQATLPTIRANVQAEPSYGAVWSSVISNMASTATLRAILSSLFVHLTPGKGLDSSLQTRSLVAREAVLVRGLLGRLSKDRRELWDSVSNVVLGREWDIFYARVLVFWVSGARKGTIDPKALEIFLSQVVDLWTSPDHIRHSLLNKHHYLTALLLLTISYLSIESNSTAITSLAFSPPFVTSISTYLTHLDHFVRRCGMLVAEEVASRAGKKLEFGDWDGDSEGRDWCRSIRQLIKERDIDVEASEADSDHEFPDTGTEAPKTASPSIIQESHNKPTSTKIASRKPTVQELYDSDDSLTGYASSPSSSRSSSPTPSELEEIEKDPTLRVGQKKIARPVYLAQLGEMVRPTSSVKTDIEEGEVKKIEVALDAAEELIRRKRSYGTELEENAVNLVYGFVGLQDNYELEDFGKKRQAALNALVACCPRKSAAALIEEFYKNQYSADQRYAILNALALGARELASLPIPVTSAPQPVAAAKITFPSKRLPTSLHNRYATTGDQPNARAQVQNLLQGISKETVDKSSDATANKVPEIMRERQLRIVPAAKVTKISPGPSSKHLPASSQMIPATETKFTDVAAEFFICPMINRFWVFLRDEQTREARTENQSTLHRYRGAGTGLILNALVLSHLLATLAILVHAARNAKEWVAIIAPDALELAVTLGTRRLSQDEGEDEEEDEDDIEIRTTEARPKGQGKGKGKEAAVLTTSLELALVVLDGSVDIDGGRSLSLENTALVMGVGEWASEVLTRLEKGARVLGGGGVQEVKLRHAAAGVVLKVEEVTSRWQRSMISAGY